MKINWKLITDGTLTITACLGWGMFFGGIYGIYKHYFTPNPIQTTTQPILAPAVLPANDEANFTFAVNFLLSNEGGYSNVLQDKGGETNFGIASNYITGVDVKTLSRADAIKIYKTKYWEGTQIPFIEDNFLRTKFFDTAVLVGYTTATILLQRALQCTGLEVVDDGIFGKKTLRNVNECKNPFGLQWAFIAHISNYMKDIVERDATQKIFLQGWLTRIHDVVGD